MSNDRPFPVQIIPRLVIQRKNGHQLINGLIIRKKIGQGAYATVKLGEKSTEPGVFRALKEISKSALSKKLWVGSNKATSALDKVKQEIEIMKLLFHPNIPELIAVIDDSTEDKMYLIMEFCELGPLLDIDKGSATYKSHIFPLTQCGGLPFDVVRKALLDVLEALEYLHELGIAHRDIKPDNLLVSKDGTIKLADFGVSHLFGSGVEPILTGTEGTYAFFSPEMCTGEAFNAFEADLWAVGVSLFALVFGTVPWYDTSPPALFEKIRETVVEFPAKIDEDLEELLRSMLAKDLKKRPDIATIREHRWVVKESTDRTEVPEFKLGPLEDNSSDEDD